MKKLITILITLGILFALSYGLAFITNTKFMDFTFFVGLTVSGLIWFLNSKGGFSSRNLDMSVQSTTGIKTDIEKFKFHPNIAFFTSITYTVLSLAATFFYYRSYFI